MLLIYMILNGLHTAKQLLNEIKAHKTKNLEYQEVKTQRYQWIKPKTYNITTPENQKRQIKTQRYKNEKISKHNDIKI